MVWNKKIADYKEGYSYTAAPIIVNGLVVTGNSGRHCIIGITAPSIRLH